MDFLYIKTRLLIAHESGIYAKIVVVINTQLTVAFFQGNKLYCSQSKQINENGFLLFYYSYKDASVELVDTALALAKAYASTGREEAESM